MLMKRKLQEETIENKDWALLIFARNLPWARTDRGVEQTKRP